MIYGNETLTYDVRDDLISHLTLSDKGGQLLLNIKGSGSLKLTLDVLQNGTWDILILHTGAGTLKVHETVNLHQDAHVRLSYGQLSQGDVHKTSHYNLVGQGAQLHSLAAVLSNHSMKWLLQANHTAPHTYASLDSNIVVGDHGHCNVEVIGSIPKGNIQSKTHQMTKILNLGNDSVAMVYPKLLIDENDVEASHAASVGQPEEEHIYYLMSRGLSHSEAMTLLIKGYLHPVVNRIEDEPLKQTLLEIIETEVSRYA